MNVHVVLTQDVKAVLTKWAKALHIVATRNKSDDEQYLAHFMQGLTELGMNTGTNINRDALEYLRDFAKDSGLTDANIVLAWLDKHGVK